MAPAPSPQPPPAGAPAASVLALPLSAIVRGPFALNAGAPVAAGFQAPAYLQGFKFSQLPAYSVLPAVSSCHPPLIALLPVDPQYQLLLTRCPTALLCIPWCYSAEVSAIVP